MPTYLFNPHRHVKIWLSRDPQLFLSQHNQLRLIRMRQANPNDDIHFFYDSRLLNEAAQDELKRYCQTHRIIPLDIVEEVLHQAKSALETQMLVLYNDEILNLEKGGNLACASDILRTLSAVYSKGCYADFDVEIRSKDLPECIEVHAPILVRISSFFPYAHQDKERISVNNEIFAVVDAQAAQHHLTNIQKVSLQLAGIQTSQQAEHQNPYYQLADFNGMLLRKLSTQQTARQIRHSIFRLCKSNEVFYRLMQDFSFFHVEEERLYFDSQAIKITPEILKEIEHYLKTKMTHDLAKARPKHQQEIAEVLLHGSVIDNNRLELQDELITHTVINTTGSSAFCMGLFFKNEFTPSEMQNKVNNFALAHYGLERYFYSKNGYPLHASAEEKQRHLAINDNDLSWLPNKHRFFEQQNQKMADAADIIKTFFKQKMII